MRGLFTFEDFIVALIILALSTALIVSNLFIFDHRTVEQMLSVRNSWNADSTADMIAKKYITGAGELDIKMLERRPLPERVEIRVGALRYGDEAPSAGEVYSSNRLVFVNGRAELLVVKTW
ncbi:hypothetical protein DRN67_00035 [Candidatus Micrarchaeota archaeon]|nr:MAG: hypothetical protein DRN67_00035 [Candidatus Micrarchaeota archaeon]